MTRARRAPAAPIDPLDAAVLTDTMGIAGDLESILEAVRGYDQGSIKVIVFKIPQGKLGALGKFEWIEEIPAPFDISEIMASLKARYGGGTYRLSIFAGGKTRRQIEIPIFGEPIVQATAALPPGEGTPNSMFMMLMAQAAESRREMIDQQRFAMEQQRDRDARQMERDRDRSTQFMQAMTIVVPVVAPLLFGGREKMADLIAIMNAGKSDGNSLKETVELMAVVKTLLKDGDNDGKLGGFDADDMVGSIARVAGPMIGAVGRAFGSARPGGQSGGDAEGPPQYGDGHLQLSAPDPAPAVPITATLPASAGSRVLDLIKPHVLYFFSANLDPGLAAEAVADIMEREGISQEDVNDLVAAFGLSADWKADLAAQGLDLRSNPEWADTFVTELVDTWTNAGGHRDDRPGGAGSLGDLQPDADPSAAGLPLNGGPGPGTESDVGALRN